MKNKLSENSPIGIFDSGLGGLTVLRSLEKILPNESFIYFGDTAHVPYGNKSINSVIQYSQTIVEFFIKKNIKAIVIACNTASSVAYEYLQKKYSIPLFDVVSPCVDFIINDPKIQKIGVIGTISTINSKAYSKQFNIKENQYSIIEIPCPLFVPLIEEGWEKSIIAKEVAKIYLNKLNNKNIDKLILGCTHYPLMANTIKSVIHENTELIFSGDAVANKLYNYLLKNNLLNKISLNKKNDFFVSDYPQKFDELASRFLGRKLNNVNHVIFD